MQKSEPISGTWNSGLQEGAAKAGEALGDLAHRANEKVSEMGRAGGDLLAEGQKGAANALQSTAESVREAGWSSSDALADLTGNTARKLEAAAQYVREQDCGSMYQDMKAAVRRNPGPSIVAAVAIGCLAGAVWRRRNQ